MYLHNKYTITYYNIIAQAQSRTLDCYTENHHIIPKSLGGSNDSDNLVALTAREHFLCHWLSLDALCCVYGKSIAWQISILTLWIKCDHHFYHELGTFKNFGIRIGCFPIDSECFRILRCRNHQLFNAA